MSCNFMSSNFTPCYLVRHFRVRHFQSTLPNIGNAITPFTTGPIETTLGWSRPSNTSAAKAFPWYWFIGHSLHTREFVVSWRSSSTYARARRSVLVHCPARTKSLPDTLRIGGSSMTSLWRRKETSKKWVRDITRISCFVTTMKLPHALQIYSTVFVRKCMWLHYSR